MAESNHTPGPWRVPGDGYERQRADGSPWRSLNVYGGTEEHPIPVAEVCVPAGKHFRNPTTDANAALIASAPALLAALENAPDEDTITYGARSRGKVREVRAWLESVRSAIASARGSA